MSRPTSPRAVIAAVAVVLAVLPATAYGAQPIEQFHDHFTDSYSTDLCGIAVDVRAVVTSNFTLYADDTFKNTSSIQNTIMNPQNGKSVIQSSAGQVTGSAPTVDEQAGTITFVTSYKGASGKIQTAHGRVLLRAIVKCCGSRPDRNQAATFSLVVVVWSSVTRMPSLNCAPASTSATSSWPLKRRQRCWAASSSL